MAELVNAASVPAVPAPAPAGAAKKGKKSGAAPEVPRFGRVRSNLKVNCVYSFNICSILLFILYDS